MTATSLRVGSFVYATDQGLGILAKSFYDAGVVTNVMVIRHGRHTTHDDWYPAARQVTDLRNPRQRRDMEEFAKSMDTMLFFETPFHWPVIDVCRRARVRTALMPMFECEPQVLPAQPDVFINPSLLDQRYYPSGVFISVPVNYRWRQRTRARVFVHNAGHGGLKNRNGTAELLEALWLCDCLKGATTSAECIIRYQGNLPDTGPRGDFAGKLQWRHGTVDYDTLYEEGDVFVFPEKFNGLSLPLQEARAAGMLVMCGDRFPMNTWLPRHVHNRDDDACPLNDPETYCNPVVSGLDCTCPGPLIPVAGYRKNRIGPPYNEFDEAVFDPRQIAATIDAWYDKDITDYSYQGKLWAEQNSWAKLKPKYMEVLAS